MATENQSDRFIMLLSADWFCPYWPNFGFVFSAPEQGIIVAVARKLTKRFMKGADTYWGVDLSEGRIKDTRVSFVSDLRRAGLDPGMLTQLGERLDAVRESAEFDTTLWLFGALLDELRGSAESLEVPGVGSTAVQTIRSLWELSETTELTRRDLEGASMASDTPWDRFLRGVTPDLPTYLSDWAMTGLQKPSRFRHFWAQLFWVISQKDRLQLKQWLEHQAMKLADPAFTLAEPDWMRVE